jgi:hypothetical protein
VDQNERIRLQKQYEQYADSQVLAMLQDGPDAFVEGAYVLLEAEARRRGLSLQSEDVETQARAEDVPQSPEVSQPDTFVEIMVINLETDRDAAAAQLEAAGVAHHFLQMSVTGKAMPLALMVDQRQIEAAIGKLQPVKFSGSIVLW